MDIRAPKLCTAAAIQYSHTRNNLAHPNWSHTFHRHWWPIKRLAEGGWYLHNPSNTVNHNTDVIPQQLIKGGTLQSEQMEILISQTTEKLTIVTLLALQVPQTCYSKAQPPCSSSDTKHLSKLLDHEHLRRRATAIVQTQSFANQNKVNLSTKNAEAL